MNFLLSLAGVSKLLWASYIDWKVGWASVSFLLRLEGVSKLRSHFLPSFTGIPMSSATTQQINLVFLAPDFKWWQSYAAVMTWLTHNVIIDGNDKSTCEWLIESTYDCFWTASLLPVALRSTFNVSPLNLWAMPCDLIVLRIDSRWALELLLSLFRLHFWAWYSKRSRKASSCAKVTPTSSSNSKRNSTSLRGQSHFTLSKKWLVEVTLTGLLPNRRGACHTH